MGFPDRQVAADRAAPLAEAHSGHFLATERAPEWGERIH